jgi:hypothetical protein
MLLEPDWPRFYSVVLGTRKFCRETEGLIRIFAIKHVVAAELDLGFSKGSVRVQIVSGLVNGLGMS